MELKNFISNTLIDIVEGVNEAQEHFKENKIECYVCPPMKKHDKEVSDRGLPIENIDFDIAVSISKDKGTKGSVGIVISQFKLGSQGESKSKDSSSSRIKFSVPLTLPTYK